MQAIHDSLPHPAVQLFARDVMRFIDEQITQEWIAATDSLPNDGQTVIFKTNPIFFNGKRGKHIFTGKLINGIVFGFLSGNDEELVQADLCTQAISHWMLLTKCSQIKKGV